MRNSGGVGAETGLTELKCIVSTTMFDPLEEELFIFYMRLNQLGIILFVKKSRNEQHKTESRFLRK